MKAGLVGWRTSSHSGPQGNCVEVGGSLAAVGVRDTKDRDSGTLTFTPEIWHHFLRSLRD